MEFALLLIIIIAGFGVLAYLITRKSQKNDLQSVIELLQTGSQEDRKLLLTHLSENNVSLNARLDATARLLADVQKHVGEVSEIGRSMRDMQEFLRSPKLRGNIGEHILKELLAQTLPKNSFTLQFAFRSGEKVDAAITTSAGVIPIDSKFPMENFRRMMSKDEAENMGAERAFEHDIKLHIDAISKKYILPDEGTVDYALMYVPSEAVYYEIVNNERLFDYASSRRVLPVSPTTFYAYLKAILMSFEGQKIEAQAKEIIASLRAVQKDYEKVNENLSTLQKHVMNANNMMTTVITGFSSLGQKIQNAKTIKHEETKILPE